MSKEFREIDFYYPRVKELVGRGASTDVIPIESAMVSDTVNLYRLHNHSSLFYARDKIIFFSRGTAAHRGPWPILYRGFMMTRNDVPHSSGRVISSSQRTLPNNT